MIETNASALKVQYRENFMDALRGFAILGIFIANLHAFSAYYAVEPGTIGPYIINGWDSRMLFLHHMFIEGKFYSIFSFLFGWGMALQIMRLEEKGIKSVSLIRRRLGFMLVLGAFHLLLWPGDIVFFYALLGFVLLLFRKLSDKALVISAVLLLISPVLLYYLKMSIPILNAPVGLLRDAGDWTDHKLTGIDSEEAYRTFIRNADWGDIIRSNIPGFFYRYADLFFQSRISKVLGMMLIGMAVGRTRFYRNISQNKKLLYYLIVFGILIALPANYMLAKYMQEHDGSYYGLKINGLYRTTAYAIGVAALAAAYIAVFMFLFQTTAGKKLLSILEPVGKMAFTNYILHTLIGSYVFYYAGLGYTERVGPVYYTALAMIVFAAQIIMSTLWLRYFNYGPLEWIWRCATYGKWQKMRKNE